MEDGSKEYKTGKGGALKSFFGQQPRGWRVQDGFDEYRAMRIIMLVNRMGARWVAARFVAWLS